MEQPPRVIRLCGTWDNWLHRRCTWCIFEDCEGGHPEEPCAGPLCGGPAAIHVLWLSTDESFTTGYLCPEHAPMLLQIEHLQWHPLKPDCGMPGCTWSESNNDCREADECLCGTCRARRHLAEEHEPLRMGEVPASPSFDSLAVEAES